MDELGIEDFVTFKIFLRIVETDSLSQDVGSYQARLCRLEEQKDQQRPKKSTCVELHMYVKIGKVLKFLYRYRRW